MTADEILDTVHHHLDQPLENLGLLVQTQTRLQSCGFTTVRDVVSASQEAVASILKNGKETRNSRLKDLEDKLHDFCPFLSLGMKVPEKQA